MLCVLDYCCCHICTRENDDDSAARKAGSRECAAVTGECECVCVFVCERFVRCLLVSIWLVVHFVPYHSEKVSQTHFVHTFTHSRVRIVILTHMACNSPVCKTVFGCPRRTNVDRLYNVWGVCRLNCGLLL